MPRETGIQLWCSKTIGWTPAFAGVTDIGIKIDGGRPKLKPTSIFKFTSISLRLVWSQAHLATHQQKVRCWIACQQPQIHAHG